MCKSCGRILIDIIMESLIRIGMMPIDNTAFFYLQGNVIFVYGMRFYAPRVQYYFLTFYVLERSFFYVTVSCWFLISFGFKTAQASVQGDIEMWEGGGQCGKKSLLHWAPPPPPIQLGEGRSGPWNSCTHTHNIHYRIQNIEHRTQNTEHRTQNTEYRNSCT